VSSPAPSDPGPRPAGGRREGDEISPVELITFRPFTVGELRARLELAGLREVDTDFDASRDRYAVVAVTT
jgi:hypothetical protein